MTNENGIETQVKMIKTFRRLGDSMPVAQIDFFLNAAKHEGRCIADVAKASRVAKNSATRYLKCLSDSDDQEQSGLRLLYSFTNPPNRKQKLVVLNSAGHAVLRTIEQATQ